MKLQLMVLARSLCGTPNCLSKPSGLLGALLKLDGGIAEVRLCPADSKDVAEESCFQQTPLEFVEDTQWIQFGRGMDVNNRTGIPAVTLTGDRRFEAVDIPNKEAANLAAEEKELTEVIGMLQRAIAVLDEMVAEPVL